MDDCAAQVQACLHFLTEHGDGVQRFDSAFLHNLAAAACLTPAQLVIVARIARRYERQLEAAGLFVPAPEAIDAYLDAQKILAGKLAEEQREAFALSAHGDEKKNPNRIYLHHDRIIGNRLVVEFPFDRIKVAAVQPLKEAVDGWRFDYLKRKEWSYPFAAAARVIDALARFKDFEVGAGVTGLVAQCRYQETLARELAELEASLLEQEREVALEAIYPYLQGAPLADGHPLYQHQREAVRTLIVQQRCILAHDLGLGKTRSALIAAKSYSLSILVVAPAGLHINWQREAEAADVAIELISWAKMPEPPDVAYILIADEAHYAQSLDAQRTQAFLKLAEQAHAVFPVTGTPMKNSKPINLLPLLMAIRHPLAANRRLYEEYHCAGYYRKVGRKQLVYDTGGAAHLDELHRKIKDQVLFKKKEECLDLPPKIRMLRTAEVSSLALKEFQKTLERLRMEHNRRMQAKLEDRLQELLAELGEESELINREELAAELAEDEDNAIAILEMGMLRHAGSLAKVESAVELAQEALEEGGSVVVFSVYHDTAAKLAQKLACDTLTGDTPLKERQYMIDAFQARESRALVCTYGAGGVGITLTAAQTVILVDRPWTPGDTVQAEDRCIAEGQLVVSEQVLRPIESINIGDKVLTHTGNWRVVTATKKREHRGLMTRITYTRYSEPLLCTHDHKIFVKRGDNPPAWMKAHETLPGDFLVMPRPRSLEHQPTVRLPSTSRHSGTMVNNWGVTQTNGRYRMLAEQFELNDDLLWLFGWYLAEGFSSTVPGKGRFISLAAHENERSMLEGIQQTLRGMGVNSTIYADGKDKGIELRAYSYELAHWFSEWFGDGCESKRIPSFLLHLPARQTQTLVDTYIAGDGYARKRQLEWVSVSPALTSQMALLALQCGHAPTLRMVDNDTHNKGQWIGCFTIDGKPDNQSLANWDEQYVYHPIREVETFYAQRRPTPTYVYDLTVEEDHSFVVGQAIVHNCHRIGQQGSVTSIWVQFGGLDLRIDALLQQKQERIDQVLRGKRKTLRGLPSVRALAGEILASVRDDTPLEEFLSLYGLTMPDGSLSEAPAWLPEAERVAPGVPTPATGKRSRPAHRRSRQARSGLRKDGGRDRRLKGEVSRVRLNVRLDEEVVAFLRTMKASNQTTTEEGGYSGFLEERVRESREFQRWSCECQQ